MTHVGEMVDAATVERRVAALDSAWAALVNASHAAPAVVAEAHAWVTFRKQIEAQGGFSRWLTATASTNELDAWARRYSDAYAGAGSPAGAPSGKSLEVATDDVLGSVAKLALGLAGVVLGVALFRGGRS